MVKHLQQGKAHLQVEDRAAFAQTLWLGLLVALLQAEVRWWQLFSHSCALYQEDAQRRMNALALSNARCIGYLGCLHLTRCNITKCFLTAHFAKQTCS